MTLSEIIVLVVELAAWGSWYILGGPRSSVGRKRRTTVPRSASSWIRKGGVLLRQVA